MPAENPTPEEEASEQAFNNAQLGVAALADNRLKDAEQFFRDAASAVVRKRALLRRAHEAMREAEQEAQLKSRTSEATPAPEPGPKPTPGED